MNWNYAMLKILCYFVIIYKDMHSDEDIRTAFDSTKPVDLSYDMNTLTYDNGVSLSPYVPTKQDGVTVATRKETKNVSVTAPPTFGTYV